VSGKRIRDHARTSTAHTLNMTTLSTQWSMVINNPSANDYALVTRGYPDYVREMIWTKEIGENGTEHIQAYVKLQRSQRMSFIKKLFPRGHFKSITRDEYSLNTKEYAQKDDETTAGQHRQVYNEPIPAADTLLYRLVEEALKLTSRWIRKLWEENTSTLDHPDKPDSPFNLDKDDWIRFADNLSKVEHATVRLQPRVEKILVSAQYKSIKKEWLKDIAMRIITTQYEHGINEAERQEAILPVYEEADPDVDGEESDTDSESGGSVSSEGSGTDEDLGSATDSSAD